MTMREPGARRAFRGPVGSSPGLLASDMRSPSHMSVVNVLNGNLLRLGLQCMASPIGLAGSIALWISLGFHRNWRKMRGRSERLRRQHGIGQIHAEELVR